MIVGFSLLGLAALCLALFIYPYVIYPRLLALLPRRGYGPASGTARTDVAAPPAVALFFCAYNEERALPEKLANLRDLKTRFPELAIHAYSDASTDQTNALLRGAADVLTPHVSETRQGKATGMRTMVKAAQADLLVFTDANVVLPPDDLARLIAYFDDPEIGAVSATLNYVHGPDAPETATAAVGKAYWDREERLKRLESATGSMMGCDGAAFARRRDAYPDVPPHLLDDFLASFSVLFQGLRCVAAPDVNAYERVIAGSADEFRRKRRIACRAFNTYRHLSPALRTLSAVDRFKFASHKLLRWFGGFFLAGAALFSAAGASLIVGLWPTLALGALGLVLAAAAWRRTGGALGKLGEILKAVIATGVGVVEALQGKTYQTWAPAGSR